MPLSCLVEKLPAFRSDKSDSHDDNKTPQNPFTGLIRRSDLPRNLRQADQQPIIPGALAYPSRLEPGTIRLLVLYPSSDAQNILMSTWVRSLDDANDDYCALSYVWGSPDETVPVFVNRYQFGATKNLAAALRSISAMLQEHEVVLLWVDAISINQQDMKERNEQVAAMISIYENAAFVACWLGEDNAQGIDYLNELGRFATARDENPSNLAVKRPNVDFAAHVKGRYRDIRAGAQLISHPYWQRVWTVQEYSSPKPGVFVGGASWMDQSVFTPALQIFTQSVKMVARSAERQGYDSFFVDSALQHTRKILQRHHLTYIRANPSAYNPELLDSFRLLIRFWTLQSSDPRDKVYAPLVMSKTNRGLLEAIQVDYGVPVAELYTRVAVLWMGNDKWPLAMLELSRLDTHLHLPSWVPDWTKIPRNMLSQDGRTGEQVVCASKGAFTTDLPPTHHILATGENVLALEGIMVDSVVRMWPTMHSHEIIRSRELSIEVAATQGIYAATGETMASAYRNTISPGLSEAQLDFRDAVDGRLILATRKHWRLDSKVVLRSDRRRLAQTSRGFLGLIPAEAEANDEVWLISGGNMFYILRRGEDGTHMLIGEAYMHGLMQGELSTREELYPGGLPRSERVTLR